MVAKFFAVALLFVGAACALSFDDAGSYRASSGFRSRQASLVEVMNKIRDKAPIDELRKILATIDAHINEDLKNTRTKLLNLQASCKAKSASILGDVATVKKQIDGIRREVAVQQSKLEAENVELTKATKLINSDRNSLSKDEVNLAHLDQEKEDSQLTFEQKIAELKSFLEALYDIKAVVLSSVLIKRSDHAGGPNKLQAGVDRQAQSVAQPSQRQGRVAPKAKLSAEEQALGDGSRELVEGADTPAQKQVKALLLSLSERVAPEHREELDLARSLIEAGAPIDDLVNMIEKLIHNVEKDIKALRMSHAKHVNSVSQQAKFLRKLIRAILSDINSLKSRSNNVKSIISSITDKLIELSRELKSRVKEIRLLKKQYKQNEEDCWSQIEALKKDIASLLEEKSVLANLRNLIEKKIGNASLYVKKRIGHVSLSYSYTTGAWDACSVTCGQGTQSRSVKCTSFSGEKADDHHCANFTRPRSIETCRLPDCPVDCVLSEWKKITECSTSCGAGVYTYTREVITQAMSGGRPCGEMSKTVPCDNPACGALGPVSNFESGKRVLAAVGHSYISLDSKNPVNHLLKFSGCSSRVVDAIVGKYVKSMSGKYRVTFDYRVVSANLKKPTDGLTVGLVDREHNHIILATRDRSVPSAVYHFGNVPDMDRDSDFVRVSFEFDAKAAPTGRFFPHKQSAQPVEISKVPVAVFLSEHNTSGAGCGQVEVDNVSVEEARE